MTSLFSPQKLQSVCKDISYLVDPLNKVSAVHGCPTHSSSFYFSSQGGSGSISPEFWSFMSSSIPASCHFRLYLFHCVFLVQIVIIIIISPDLKGKEEKLASCMFLSSLCSLHSQSPIILPVQINHLLHLILFISFHPLNIFLSLLPLHFH